MTIDTLGLILVPISLFVIGAIIGAVKGAIRFAQYLVRSEEAQQRAADTLQEISAGLTDFKKETVARLGAHDQVLAVLQWEIDHRNGRTHAPRPSVNPH